MISKKIDTIKCSQCGDLMHKVSFSTGNFIGILLALIVFICGIWVAVTFGFVGFLIGILMIIISLGMGGKRKKIWECNKCGYFFEYRDKSGSEIGLKICLLVLIFYLFSLIFNPNKTTNNTSGQAEKAQARKIENQEKSIPQLHSDVESKSSKQSDKQIYKGKDNQGNTIYSDKPSSEIEKN